jgi:hypothetical protein
LSFTTLRVFVVLVLLALPWVALMKSWFVEREFRSERNGRGSDFKSWLGDRRREIQTRLDADYERLRGDIDALAGRNTAALERFHAAYDGRLAAVENRPSVAGEQVREQSKIAGQSQDNELRDKLHVLARIGTETIQPGLRTATHSPGPMVESPLDRVIRWENEVCEVLKMYRPRFQEVFLWPFEPPAGTDVVMTRLAIRIERLNALRAALS